jgi:hypothetical protein
LRSAQLREDKYRVSLTNIEVEQRSWKLIAVDWASHEPDLDLPARTGLQKGSRYGLTRDMVDLHSRTLHISRTKNPHTSPVSVTAVAALRVVQERGELTRRVFQSRGYPMFGTSGEASDSGKNRASATSLQAGAGQII